MGRGCSGTAVAVGACLLLAAAAAATSPVGLEFERPCPATHPNQCANRSFACPTAAVHCHLNFSGPCCDKDSDCLCDDACGVGCDDGSFGLPKEPVPIGSPSCEVSRGVTGDIIWGVNWGGCHVCTVDGTADGKPLTGSELASSCMAVCLGDPACRSFEVGSPVSAGIYKSMALYGINCCVEYHALNDAEVQSVRIAQAPTGSDVAVEAKCWTSFQMGTCARQPAWAPAAAGKCFDPSAAKRGGRVYARSSIVRIEDWLHDGGMYSDAPEDSKGPAAKQPQGTPRQGISALPSFFQTIKEVEEKLEAEESKIDIDARCISSKRSSFTMRGRGDSDSMLIDAGLYNSAASGSRRDEEFKVSCITLRDLYDQYKLKVETHIFIKMDIEGAEAVVVPTLDEWFSSMEVKPTLFISFHGAASVEQKRQIARVLNLYPYYAILQGHSDLHSSPSSCTFGVPLLDNKDGRAFSAETLCERCDVLVTSSRTRSDELCSRYIYIHIYILEPYLRTRSDELCFDSRYIFI